MEVPDMSNVKIHRGEVAYIDHHRTEAQRAQDDIFDKAASHAEEALEHVNKALDWLAILTQPKNRTVPVYVRQLLEEITELKRVRM